MPLIHNSREFASCSWSSSLFIAGSIGAVDDGGDAAAAFGASFKSSEHGTSSSRTSLSIFSCVVFKSMIEYVYPGFFCQTVKTQNYLDRPNNWLHICVCAISEKERK